MTVERISASVADDDFINMSVKPALFRGGI
jgi:hypothetical protein